jgi:TonB family protein
MTRSVAAVTSRREQASSRQSITAPVMLRRNLAEIVIAFPRRNRQHGGMSQRPPAVHRSRPVGVTALLAVLLLFGAGTTEANWSSKPAPPLPLSVLDQGWQGAVTLRLMLENSGRVRDVQIVRSSGIPALDQLAVEGASKWRLDPQSVRPSDLTRGRDHVVKFYQNARVGKRVPPVKAFWIERTR